MPARIEAGPMSPASRMGLAIVALVGSLSYAATAVAADYAGAISAYRRAHGLSAVRLDSRLDAVARRQARAMAASGTVSHSVGGEFTLRVASLRKAIAAETSARDFRPSPTC